MTRDDLCLQIERLVGVDLVVVALSPSRTDPLKRFVVTILLESRLVWTALSRNIRAISLVVKNDSELLPHLILISVISMEHERQLIDISPKFKRLNQWTVVELAWRANVIWISVQLVKLSSRRYEEDQQNHQRATPSADRLKRSLTFNGE